MMMIMMMMNTVRYNQSSTTGFWNTEIVNDSSFFLDVVLSLSEFEFKNLHYLNEAFNK